MTHALANPMVFDAGQGLTTGTSLPIMQEDLIGQSMTEISGGLGPFALGFLVGVAVSAVTNPVGTAETVQWYWDRAKDAVDYVAGDVLSDMADGLSNIGG